MDATHRLLVKENGRLYRENRNLSNRNLKLTEKFGAFARTLENLLTEFREELSTDFTQIPSIFQIKQGRHLVILMLFPTKNYIYKHVIQLLFRPIIYILSNYKFFSPLPRTLCFSLFSFTNHPSFLCFSTYPLLLYFILLF